MTLAELLQFLDGNTPYTYLQDSPQQSLEAAVKGTHPDVYAGEIIKAIAENCGCSDANCILERGQTVNALGAIRLKYMADDAPVEGFRTVEKTILAIDGAYNEEALRQKT